MSEGVPFSRTTFRRHRQEVEDVFGIIIDCDADSRYYIEDTSLMSDDSVPQWILGTLSVSNVVGEARGLRDRILLEGIEVESEHLRQVVEAMKNNHRIIVYYQRYGCNEPHKWTLEPYCIKLFRRRWYLLGKHAEGGYITLSFDRMTDIKVTDEIFSIDGDFDSQAYFSEYFGVMTDFRIPLQRIVLRAYGDERYAMRTLPIHQSQKEISKGDEHIDFEVWIHPTEDFLAHIMSRGRWLKVLSPDNMVQEIKRRLQSAADSYE